MKKWLNYWLHDYCDGSYGFAVLTICAMILGAFMALTLVVITYGIILIPLLFAGVVWAVLRWADEEST